MTYEEAKKIYNKRLRAIRKLEEAPVNEDLTNKIVRKRAIKNATNEAWNEYVNNIMED